MIANSKVRDDLDLVSACYNPKAGHIAINMPSVGRDLFESTPQVHYGNEKAMLSVPPRLPRNTALVAIHVFNNGKAANEQIKNESIQIFENAFLKSF